MRGAPPVQMACGRDARAAAGAGLLSAMAAASLFGWLAWQATWPSGLVVTGLVAAVLVGGVIGCWRAWRPGVRRLAWDGRTWTLDGTPGVVAVMIDTGDWLLLRFQAQHVIAWLPLALRQGGAAAHLARAALQAHAGQRPADGPAGHDPHG